MTAKFRAFSCLALGLSLSAAWPQSNQLTTATAPAKEALSPTEQAIKDIKNPVSWFSWGTDLRLRNEYFYDILTLTPNNRLHEQDYFRFRARLWASVMPIDDVSINTRLATEPREWMRPAGYTPFKGHSGLDMTEGVFDAVNVQWKNILEQPMSLVVGRQDLFFGDGWLVGDGTPYDGSWTYFLDSAKMTYELKEQHTTLELIGIIQDAKDDGWMPVINDQDRYLTEQNEKGAIVSIGNSSLPTANATAYFIYKHDDKVSGFSGTCPAPRGGDNADIYTFGGRLNGLVAEHWKYWAEGAYQFGRKQDLDVAYPAPSTAFRHMNAFGVNSKLTYLFKDHYNNQLFLAYEFLSGDDPNTGSDEMFDVLWGRWARWSDTGLYTFAAETRVGQEANMHRVGPGWSIEPTKKMTFTTVYYALIAQEDVPTRAVPGLFSNTGNFRGHFVQASVKYKFSQHLSSAVCSEMLFPGDYYISHDAMSFFRGEVTLTF
jgi:hypothetical protein